MRKHASILLSLLCCITLLWGQNRQHLEDKRKTLLKDIRRTDALLRETKKNKRLTYERYLAVREQISKREELVQTIQQEIATYDASWQRTAEVIESLEEDVVRLKEDYQQLLKMAYRRKLMKSDLLFIFSSESFNDAYKRWQYLKQYDKYRKRQAIRIVETQRSLERKLELQKRRKRDKERLLGSEQNHLIQLEKELVIKDKLLKELKRDERQLRKQIEQKRIEHEELNAAIEQIIGKDIVEQQRNNPAPTPEAGASPSSATDYTAAFQGGRGVLPWPVQGVISSYFGKQNHPTLKDIVLDNSGIDILTQRGAVAKVVATGEVAAVRFVPGSDYLVIVQHGHFYTLYSNLEGHYVEKGDIVKKGEEIGLVHTEAGTGKTELHFEIWRKHTRLNPRDWIAP